MSYNTVKAFTFSEDGKSTNKSHYLLFELDGNTLSVVVKSDQTYPTDAIEPVTGTTYLVISADEAMKLRKFLDEHCVEATAAFI
jgi:hypothetical protein